MRFNITDMSRVRPAHMASRVVALANRYSKDKSLYEKV